MALYQRGRIWWADFYGPNGRRIQESTKKTNRRDAEKFLALRMSEVQRGVYAAPSTITVAEMAGQHLEHAKLHKRSWVRDEQLGRSLVAYFGDCKLSEVTVFGIEGFKRKRSKDVSPATVNRELA